MELGGPQLSGAIWTDSGNGKGRKNKVSMKFSRTVSYRDAMTHLILECSLLALAGQVKLVPPTLDKRTPLI